MSIGSLCILKDPQIRLMITGIVLAIKYNDDNYYDNVFYSKVGGITSYELNSLESEMLRLLAYDLYVSQEAYEHCLKAMGSYETGSKVATLPQVPVSSAFLKKVAASAAGEVDSTGPCSAYAFPKIPSQESIKTVPSSGDLVGDSAGH